MPGTADRVARNETFGEGTAVVCALRADREHVLPRPHEHDALSERVTEQQAADFQVLARDSLFEIRSRKLVRSAHEITSSPRRGAGRRGAQATWGSFRAPLPLSLRALSLLRLSSRPRGPTARSSSKRA